MFEWWKRRKQSVWLEAEVSESWCQVAHSYFPELDSYSDEEYEQFWKHVKLLVRGRLWTGADGLEITDEIQVTIAGIGARMARRLSPDVFDAIRQFVIYPTHYRHHDRTGIYLGLADDWGTVVLSWQAVREGLASPEDGRNTAIHELAHAIDLGDGGFDGTPEMDSRRCTQRWARVMSDVYLGMHAGEEHPVLRDYGAQNEAEFFAVATEVFFERPAALKAEEPELYAEFVRFFHLDPATES